MFTSHRINYAAVHASILCTALLAAWPALAFNSGSTGADGALNPTANVEVTLPPSGILNYTAINIPSGITVTFKPNALNTPVVLLVQGNATISGRLSVDGQDAPGSGTAGNGVLTDDGDPGSGGPGGYAGGRGGQPIGAITAASTERAGGKGLGPGGGSGSVYCEASERFSYMPGAGGGYGTAGESPSNACGPVPGYAAGSTYGANELLPLVGGSGGGGGGTHGEWSGGGGGGGGGALLLAVSGTLTLNNGSRISALGGQGGSSTYPGCSSYMVRAGGGGSGGAIRLIATTLTGSGQIYAYAQGGGSDCTNSAGNGGNGRIRLEADAMQYNGSNSPSASISTPGPVFIAGLPSLKITTIAGTPVPNAPTGFEDVRLPATTANPVTVSFATTGIPVGNIVKLSVAPYHGAEITSVSTALVGSTQAGTASTSVNLPPGGSTLQASITYTVIAALGDALSRFAGNERVERVTVIAGLDGRQVMRLVTVSGKEFAAPPEAVRIAAGGG